MTAAIAVGILVAAGAYLILQRGLVRVAIGFVLLGHAANILLVAAGVMRFRAAPLLGEGPVGRMADPLPQAFVLTAIVITFGLTVYLLTMARAGGDDDPAGDSGEKVLDPEALDEATEPTPVPVEPPAGRGDRPTGPAPGDDDPAGTGRPGADDDTDDGVNR